MSLARSLLRRCTTPVSCLYLHRVVPHRVDRVEKLLLLCRREHPDEAHRLIKGRLQKLRRAFDIAVLFDVGDHLLHEINLTIIEILIIDEARKCLHRRTMIELRDSPNEKAKRRITELPLVVRLCSEFGCEYMIQLLIISSCPAVSSSSRMILSPSKSVTLTISENTSLKSSSSLSVLSSSPIPLPSYCVKPENQVFSRV